MNYRIAARRVYWRWFGEVDLAGGPTLRMTGDATRWLRPGDVVRLRAGASGSVLEFDDYVLEREGRVLWPLWDREVQHPRGGVYAKELYAYRLRIREARYEQDYEAIAALEQYHYASDHDAVAVWRCPDGSRRYANSKPRCDRGEGRLLEIRGSTPASRFLVMELVDRLPFEPEVVGYLRLDPPLPAMHRRVPGGVEPRVRERVFPEDWIHPTFDLKGLQPRGQRWEEVAQEALDRVDVAAARVARVVIHPDYRADGLGVRLLRAALEWAQERAVPDTRRDKRLVCTVAMMARYHPFFERAGFRYLWDTASGRPVLAYPLDDRAATYIRRFLQTDPLAQEHGGRLYRSRYPKVSGLARPVVFRGVDKAYVSVLDLDALAPEVRQLLKAFGAVRRRVERQVLRGVKLRIEPGGVYLLWGASGAGKTTLLRLLWDELPDAGWVDDPEGRVEAYLPGVVEPDLGDEAILERVERRLQDVAAAAELLARVGLADAILWRARPDQLSTGQRERLRLAVLLAGRPDLLIVDEFAAHLDGANARRVARALSKLAREAGITLMISSHREEVRRALEPDRIVFVGYGSVWSEPAEREP
ncbi:GNAT family N-acetyltransferase [Oceanithermus sp.]